MVRVQQLKLPIHHTEADLTARLIKKLGIKEDALLSYVIRKQSVDARKKPELFYVYTIDATVKREKSLKGKRGRKDLLFLDPEQPYQIHVSGSSRLSERPVVIGTGPAGLFCGLELAKLGYQPLLLERGASVEERLEDVDRFWETGILNPSSNVQFGEGGAGTFSDGKLNTMVHDSAGRGRYVLETFVKFGAPKEILYQNKPHIGTDVLVEVVKNMRRQILAYGGEIRFHSQVTDLKLSSSQELLGLVVTDPRTGKSEEIVARIAVLAVGHSARDTFSMLMEQGVPMHAKAFATGVRIEHPQSMVNLSQYGKESVEGLGAAAYKLTANLPSGRGVYTFCMCPGGYVVNASSEEGRIAVNGMSYHARDGKNANSAVVVTVDPADFGSDSPLAGMEFQRRLEEAAFKAGRGKIPVQLYEDFYKNQPSAGPGAVTPMIKGAYAWSNVRSIFPEEIGDALEMGIREFDKKLKGYARGDAVLSGVESRTSSPVRIPRDETFQSSVRGLYPCGEGAGYAGGITSAAMDGLKVAEAIAGNYFF